MFIPIAGHNIPLILEPMRKMKVNLGEFDPNEEQIHMRKDLSVKLRRKTLAHECFHAFLYLTGYDQLLCTVDENFEEALTRAFEQALGGYVTFPKDVEKWVNGG